MEKYLNQEFKGCIESLKVNQGVSRDGNVYYYISLILNNGFEKRIFVSSGEQFAFSNSFESVITTKVLNKEF